MIDMTADLERRLNRDLKIGYADEDSDHVVAENFLKQLRDNEFDDSRFRRDVHMKILNFIEEIREKNKYKAVISYLDDNIIGSAGCQLYSPPYPVVFPEDYMTLGYIWGVYVEPSFRRHGIGARMTNAAIEYLRSIGCTRVLLHTSIFGRSIYEQIGFVESDEMKLNLLPKKKIEGWCS